MWEGYDKYLIPQVISELKDENPEEVIDPFCYDDLTV